MGTDAIVDVRKLPPHKQPREYGFTVVTTVTTVSRQPCRFKTRQQMERAKIEMQKKGLDPYFYASGQQTRTRIVKFEFEEANA